MHREPIYTSAIGAHIAGFISEKRASGFKYTYEAHIMRRFDEYWAGYGYADTGLTQENLAGWLQKWEPGNGSSLVHRISVIRQFSIYLNGLGIPSYMPSFTVSCQPHARLPLTRAELGEFFAQADAPPEKNKGIHNKRIADEYPVLFRLIYLNGMRISEACRLPVSHVDLDGGTIIILNGKGNKDRLVYMADDMRKLLKDYLDHIEKLLGEKPLYVFPGLDPRKPISPLSAGRKFNILWEKTSFSGSRPKPSVHDLRHTYVVDRINRWMEQGLDFEHMLPYLCKFLGHRNFRETYYYYHYAEEAAKTIREKDKVIGRVIPEVMRR